MINNIYTNLCYALIMVFNFEMQVDRASPYDSRSQQNLVFRVLFVGLHFFILYSYLLK